MFETRFSYRGISKPAKLMVRYAKPLMMSQTPRNRGRKPDLYTRMARGKSHSPHRISAATTQWWCRRRNSMASASACGFENAVRKSAP